MFDITSQKSKYLQFNITCYQGTEKTIHVFNCISIYSAVSNSRNRRYVRTLWVPSGTLIRSGNPRTGKGRNGLSTRTLQQQVEVMSVAVRCINITESYEHFQIGFIMKSYS